MPAWSYLVHNFDLAKEREHFQARLNHYGGNGWELVAITPREQGTVDLVFKKIGA